MPEDQPLDPITDGNGEVDELRGRAAWADLGSPSDFPEGDEAPTRNVTGPGLAALNAIGDRAPRSAAAPAGVDPGARDNWRPTGPRNIAGRIRALAVDPGTATTMYAASASGGIFKTVDGGDRWFPLWHDEPSLAFGAIAIAPTRPNAANPFRVYAATGETQPGSVGVEGTGVWVSDDAGANWTNHPPGAPVPANPTHQRGFDAVTVDPADRDHCWAVGKDGIFRTTDGGTTWQHFLDGVSFSDVAYSGTRLWLARAASVAGEGALIRLDPPASARATSEADVRTALGAADNLSVVVPPVADHMPWPARAKLAVSVSSPDVAYVRLTDEDERHVGVFRSRNARAAHGRDVTWQRLPDHADWAEENYGDYTLCLAVDPADANRLITGMVDLHISVNANAGTIADVRFRRAVSWQLYPHDRGYHADHHAALVVGGTLWVADDAGLAVSANWTTGEEVPRELPLQPGAISFRRRDHGISASQAYDLNQSPLVPTMYAAGFQDNGLQMTGGGPTWRMVGGGDGGFVLFDPDDPFRFLTTFQGGLDARQFPGHIDDFVPGEQPDVPIIERRRLTDGFRPLDEPAFVGDTARHPLRRDRILTARKRRVYGTRGARGERFDVEPVGRSFEIVAASDVEAVELEVVPTDGAIRLGLLPGKRLRRFPADPLTDPARRRAVVAVAGRLPAPWKLTDGDELHLLVNGADVTARFRASDVADLGKVTLAEVTKIVQAVLPAGTEILPRMWPRPRAVELVTRGRGAEQSIKIEGTALAALPDGLSRLGLNAGTYVGDDERPASFSLGFEGRLPAERTANRDLGSAPAPTLTVTVNGGAAAPPVTFQTPAFADPHGFTAGELAAALATALAGMDIDVVATDVVKSVILRADPGVTVSLSGTAVDRFDLVGTEGEALTLRVPTRHSLLRGRHVRNHNSFDLRPLGPNALTIAIGDGAASTGPIAITAPDVADVRCVTVEELHRLIRRQLAAVAGIRVRAELVIEPAEAQAEEILFPPSRPGEAWVGGADGAAFRTTDDGATWKEIGPPDARLADARTEAIAVHPTNAGVAYVGMLRSRPGPADRPLLFRTANGGDHWDPVGSSRSGGNLVGIVGNGRPLAIRALELDPADPKVVFAATDGGVFRSRDDGATWEPFSHGLPNCPVIDLAMAQGTRTLRAAAWGRGTWERRIGADLPDDVRLVVRSSERDDGAVRPPRAGPDPFADAPTGDLPRSPDIRVVRRRPDYVGADPSVDGVEFDLDLPDDAVVDMPTGLAGPDHQSEIVVQVHNRGSFPARSVAAAPPPPATDTVVRVVVLWAPLSGAPPQLPLDFWTRFKGASLQAAEGDWRLAADRRLPQDVRADAPAVTGVQVTWPRDIGTSRVGILVLVTSTDDVLDGGPTDVAELVALDRRAAFRAVPVVPAADDRTLVLRATGPRRFEVRNPDAPATTVADRLQIAPGDLVTQTRRLRSGVVGAAVYDLSVTRPGLLVIEDPVTVDIEFNNGAGEFRDIVHATPAEIASFIDARLRAAGAAADAFPLPVGVRIRALGSTRVRVVSGPAASRLGLGPMAPAAAAPQIDARNVNWFDLHGDPTLRLESRAQANRTFDVTLRADAFRDPTVADPRRIALVINRAIAANRLDGVLRCDVILGVAIDGRRDAEVTGAGTAAIPLGLGGGPRNRLESDPGTVDLTGSPQLRVTVENRVVVRFDRDPAAIPALATAAPPDVRRVLNRAFEVAEMSVRAEPARVELCISGSTTESAGGASSLGGQTLADVATSGTTPAGDPAALFDLRAALGADRLTATAPNHVYVRVRNTGTVDVRPARVRLFRVDPAPTPPTVASVVSGTVDVNAERDAVIDLSLTPTGAAGDFEHVIAVVDQDVDGRRVADPAGPDLESLAALCERRPDLSMRTFEVEEP